MKFHVKVQKNTVFPVLLLLLYANLFPMNTVDIIKQPITNELEAFRELFVSSLKSDNPLLDNVLAYMKSYDVSKAITSIFNIFSEANTYIQLAQPWAVAKQEDQEENLKAIMRSLLECIRLGCELLEPFMPDSSRKVLSALGIENQEFSNLDKFEGLKAGQKLADLSILFPRLDIAKELEELAKLS